MYKAIGWFAAAVAVAALVCAAGLLASDMGVRMAIGFPVSAISAAALLTIGAALLIAQIVRRPRWTELAKNVLLATAFLLWGAVQLMEPSELSRKLGDVVIALYVLDIAWVILANAASGPAQT